MKIFFKIMIIFSIVFFIGSCNDPIFDTVFQETPILKPYIDGSPTNFAVLGNALYVASKNKIFEYKNNGTKVTWSEWKDLGDRIVVLAANTSTLYALYLPNDNGNGRIRNLTSGTDLSLPNTYQNVQSLHASGNVLFATVRIDSGTSASYKYYRINSDTSFTEITSITNNSRLVGVASIGSNYYLCTALSGIYYVASSGSVAAIIPDTGGVEFAGMINLDTSYAVAISKEGKLYQINNTSNSTVIDSEFGNNRNSTGALAVWYHNSTDTKPTLLLVGRKETNYTTSSGYTYGYVEITLDTSTGAISGSSFSEPGTSSQSSIDDNARYVSSLGKEPVNHIIQTPKTVDSNMRLLASTQQHGVWSYRDRDDDEGIRWNSEQP